MATPPFTMSKFLSSEDLHKAAHEYYKGQCAIHEGTIRALRAQIAKLEANATDGGPRSSDPVVEESGE